MDLDVIAQPGEVIFIIKENKVFNLEIGYINILVRMNSAVITYHGTLRRKNSIYDTITKVVDDIFLTEEEAKLELIRRITEE